MCRTRVILAVSLLALCVGLTAQAGDPPNYALNGTATQSTMDWGGVPNGTAVVSFMVVDAYVIQHLFRSSRRGSCIMG